MFGIALTGQAGAIATLVIIAVMFVMFIREDQPPEVIAIGAAALMMILGLLPVEDAGSVLSNNAPWTIAFMFITMGGLLRTGALDQMSRLVASRAGTQPILTIAVMFAFVCLASAIMNNTPVVAVMIPIVIQVARRAGISDITVQGTRIKFHPVELPDSKQVRLKRLYPGSSFRAAAKAINVPFPKAGRNVTSPKLRDTELIQWAADFLSALFDVDPINVSGAQPTSNVVSVGE